MLDELLKSAVDIVITSLCMKGGKVTSVLFLRKTMSRWVNKFMRLAGQVILQFTSMARAYRRSFIKNLNLKTKDYEIRPEIIYKAMILRTRIVNTGSSGLGRTKQICREEKIQLKNIEELFLWFEVRIHFPALYHF